MKLTGNFLCEETNSVSCSIKIELNQSPSKDWISCFHSQPVTRFEYPGHYKVEENWITVRNVTFERIESRLSDIIYYVKTANSIYKDEEEKRNDPIGHEKKEIKKKEIRENQLTERLKKYFKQIDIHD